MVIKNSKGSIWYGLHFYPGIAEYREPDKDAYRVFLNEDTIRNMDPSFAGKPVFVLHVNGVDENIDELRKEADGWVIESFFNQADGKHWVKFIICSERGERAVKSGMRLSNCYFPTAFGSGGFWNGMQYEREITGGEYEHLALVSNPRYEESKILSPEEFKQYNEDKFSELKRLANEKKGVSGMFKWMRRKVEKVENGADFDSLHVELPKSKKEISIVSLINDADERELLVGKPVIANSEHLVSVGDAKMTVNELIEKYSAACNELDALKKKMEDADDEVVEDPAMENDEEDEAAKKKALELAAHEEKEMKEDERKENERLQNEAKEAKRKEAKARADRLRDAHFNAFGEAVEVEVSEDRVARGKARYGAN